MSSLKTTSFKGLTWSFIDTLFGSGITFVIGVILARILTPEVFGLIGMVTVLFAIATTIIDSGFSIGLIRKVSCTQQDYSTVFYFNIIIGIVVYALLFFTAPLIALFFKEAQLINIVRVLGLVVIIDAFSIVQRVILTRNVNFKSQTIISMASAVVSGGIGIGMAVSGYGVWSIIIQVLAKQLTNGILLWVFAYWRPALYFSTAIFKELFGFGSKLLVSGLINTIQNNIYYIVIGKYFSTAGLGYYTRAESFNAIVTNNLTGTLERVFFPVLSSMQTDEARLKITFKKMIRTSFFITFFALITLAVIAKPFILILIGAKWYQSILLLQLLCISSIFLPLNAVNLNILKIKGQSGIILHLQVIKSILLAATILCGIFWGIKCMLIARIFITFLSYLLNSFYAGKLIGYNMLEQLADVTPYFWAEFLIAVCMYAISFLPINNYLMLFVQLVVGLSLFFIVFEHKKFAEYIEIKELIVSAIFKRKKVF